MEITDLFACPDNVLDIDTSRTYYSLAPASEEACVLMLAGVALIFVLVGFVCLQVAVVLLQDYFGAGFFLPRSVSKRLSERFIEY